MKTKHLIIALAVLFGQQVLGQEKKMRVCLKIQDNKDGVVTEVDTCYEGSDEEVQIFLQSMGEGQTLIQKNGEIENEVIVRHMISQDSLTSIDSLITHIITVDDSLMNNDDVKVIIRTINGDKMEVDTEMKKMMEELEQNNSDLSKTHKEARVIISKSIIIQAIPPHETEDLPKKFSNKPGKGLEKLEMYPNPTQDVVNIRFTSSKKGIITISIYDVSGKKIQEDEYNSQSGEFQKEINLSSFQKGAYYLQVEQDDHSEIRKIVITE